MTDNQNWQIHDAQFYDTYEIDDVADEGIGVALLIPLDDEFKNDGAFRIVLFGHENETVSIPAADIYAQLPDLLAGAVIHFPAESASTLLQANCTACPWRDVNDAIRNVHSFIVTPCTGD